MLYLLKKDCKELFGSKKRIGIIGLVLIMLIISTYYNIKNQDSTNPSTMIQFGIIDNDSSAYSKILLEYFKESESFSSYINIREGNNKDIEQEFSQGSLDVYMEIPKDFAENLMYIEHVPVKVVINAIDTTKAILLKNILESYEKYISAVEINCVTLYDVMLLTGMENSLVEQKNFEISYDLIFTALGKEVFFDFREISNYPSSSLFNYYICSFLSIGISYISLFIGYQIIKEKQQGTLRRLKVIGVPLKKILFEKLLFSTVTIYIILSLLYVIPSLASHTKVDARVLLFYLLSVLFYVTVAMFLSSIFTKSLKFMIAGNILNLTFCIIGGGIIPIMYLPTELVALAKYTPNYWFIKVMLQLQNGIEQGYMFKISVLLIVSSIIFFVLSNYAYNREEACLDE